MSAIGAARLCSVHDLYKHAYDEVLNGTPDCLNDGARFFISAPAARYAKKAPTERVTAVSAKKWCGKSVSCVGAVEESPFLF